MGPLRLPSHGAIYLDTSAIIYSVERNEPYLTLLAPVWRQAEAGQFVVVCSELAVAEALVRPIRGEMRISKRHFGPYSPPLRCS